MNDKAEKRGGILSGIKASAKRWMFGAESVAAEITPSEVMMFGGGATTVASLLGTGRRTARTRQAIYNKWGVMEGDPIVSTALLLLVTASLGGHETNGDTVFIEKSAAANTDKRLEAIADEIKDDLSDILNNVAFPLAYTAAAFGDSYARIYLGDNGVIDLNTDEMIRPSLVQSFERGTRTVGYAVYTGMRQYERLNTLQLARVKMPRTQWVPQHGVVEKAIRLSITEDDIDKLPLLPSMAGGSLLYNAEEAYDNLTASLLGLVGQRWMDSIDEQLLTINMESMTAAQQKSFHESIIGILRASKDRVEKAVKTGTPIMERIRHILPVFSEKQMSVITPVSGGQSGRIGNVTIEDVMLHARMLAGAIGVDLSMLGFADQLSGGLGDGGFFRVSAQAAQKAQIIRVALSDFYNHVIDVHTMRRYGVVFSPKDRPWVINFYGSISAYEAEKQRIRADAFNSGMALLQTIQSMKDMGVSREFVVEYLTKTMLLDEAEAEIYASVAESGGEPTPKGGFR